MNGYNFTDRVRKVLQMAREEAARLHHEYVGTEHILLGLIREGEGVAAAVLTNLNVDLEEIQQKIEETVKKGKASSAPGPDLPYTSRAKKVLELAMTEARELNHSYVGTEHLLLGLLREEKGIAAQVLSDAGVSLEQSRAETLRLLGSDMPAQGSAAPSTPPSSSPKSEKKSKTPALDHFCRDLTQLAAEGQLDPTIGRHKEIERVMEILARRKKNNPVLIGEPGVGKTAIVEGLAHLIATGQCPDVLQRSPGAVARHGGGHRRHQVPGPVRGAAQGGDERDRPEQEYHPLHRRAAHPGGGRRRRRRHRCLQHAQARAWPGESSSASAPRPSTSTGSTSRRTAPWSAGSRPWSSIRPRSRRPSRSSRASGKKYEEHHRVTIPDETLKAAAELSERYITDRFLPDKAIDVIDEAGARARLATQAPPPEVAELKNELEQVTSQKEKPSAIRISSAPPRCAIRERDLQNQIRQRQDEWERERQTQAPGHRRGGHRLHRLALDRHSGHPVAGGRNQPAPPDGGGDPRGGRRAGRGHRGRVAGDPPLPRRPQGSSAGRSARSSSRAPPASGRPSWRAPWPSSCSPIPPR